MIQEVFLDHFTPAYLPNKYEAGTPNVAGAVGLAAAMKYLENVECRIENRPARIGTRQNDVGLAGGELRGFEVLDHYEDILKKKILEGLENLPFIRIIGPKDLKDRIAVFSFVMEGAHSHDVGEFMNNKGIAIRTGHHCAQPLMAYFKVAATSRVSTYIYNTEDEVEKLLIAVEECYKFFK